MELERDIVNQHINSAQKKRDKETSEPRKRYWTNVIENLVADYNDLEGKGRWENSLNINYVPKTDTMSIDDFLGEFFGDVFLF